MRIVIVEEAWRENDRVPACHEGQRCVVVVGIEIGYRRVLDDLLLQFLQRKRRAAADHQCAAFDIFFPDEIF